MSYDNSRGEGEAGFMDPEAKFNSAFERREEELGRGLNVLSKILNCGSSQRDVYRAVFPNLSSRNFNPEDLQHVADEWIDGSISVAREEGESDSDFENAVFEKRAQYRSSVESVVGLLFAK